jgi:Lrp/AsnC family leucine-responsive transcriptional regulator
MDTLDRKILRALQKNARVKNADLARQLGVAPSTMLERVRRLEERDYISGFKAVVNPEKLGLGVQALVSVSLGQHSTKTIRPFEQAVKSIPNIMVCYHVTGRFDYIFHIVAKNLKELGILVKEQIAAMPGVGKTETFLVFSEIKNDNGYPLEQAEKSEQNTNQSEETRHAKEKKCT